MRCEASPLPALPITCIDLFAGLGGIRLGVQLAADDLGIDLAPLWACDIDKRANRPYLANFRHVLSGDITQDYTRAEVPEHDLLLAGFPCQAFSVAGNGLGFADEHKGTLFFEIARILQEHRPRAVLLENVPGLITHDKGRTFKVITDTLTALGYAVTWTVLDARAWVPQRRARVYIVATHGHPPPPIPGPPRGEGPVLANILHDYRPWELREVNLEEWQISQKYWNGMQLVRSRNLPAGSARKTGFGYIVHRHDEPAYTLMQSSPQHRLVWSLGHDRPRYMTPREHARCQGFPDWFILPEGRRAGWELIGNSVPVPVIRHIARPLLAQLART